MITDILVIASVVSVIVFLDRFAGIFPSIMACMIRWKESLNLEASIKAGRERNLAAMLMFVPFCLTATTFRLYNPEFISSLDETARLIGISAVLLIYILLRKAVTFAVRPQKMDPRVYQAAGKLSLSFFTILTLFLLSTAGIMSVADISPAVIRSAMLWISAAVYILFLVRKTQIFISSCSVFAAFSYLCILEIIPTGTLVVSAIVF